MGPASLDAGRVRTSAEHWRRVNLATLQWGRHLSMPEGQVDHRLFRACEGFNGAGISRCRKAHAGPEHRACRQSFNGAGISRCRKDQGHHRDDSRGRASMGPASLDAGRARSRRDPGRTRLQWGRHLSMPEGPEHHRRRRTANVLQWGRHLSMPEGALPDKQQIRPPGRPSASPPPGPWRKASGRWLPALGRGGRTGMISGTWPPCERPPVSKVPPNRSRVERPSQRHALPRGYMAPEDQELQGIPAPRVVAARQPPQARLVAKAPNSTRRI